ncbi:MAG: membrane protein insertion efficiency factor YidD [Pseudomonadota bacterium]
MGVKALKTEDGTYVISPRNIADRAIWLYQHTLGLALGPRCRYQPTCSNYARTAITRFGLLKGGMLALRRIGRCHPLGGSGYDPVPDASQDVVEARGAPQGK